MNAEFINALAEALLPGDAHWPSGGSIDLATMVASISALVPGHTESMSELERVVGSAFIDSSPPQRQTVLEAVEHEHPDLFGVGRLLVFDAYYRHARVVEAMADRCGYRGDPPQPAGFPVGDFDPAVLSTVRSMARRWRDDTTPAA